MSTARGILHAEMAKNGLTILYMHNRKIFILCFTMTEPC